VKGDKLGIAGLILATERALLGYTLLQKNSLV
jgi:hypothetical protein